MMVSARLTPGGEGRADPPAPGRRGSADPTASALQRQERSDLGRRRLPEDLVAAIEALALRRPPPTTAYVHRIGDLARDRDLPAPNYSTVRFVVAAIDPGLRTLARDGDAAYRNQFELVHRCTAARPNEQWQADHTLLDLQILDVKQQPARPWLTIVLDDYSAQLVADAAASSAQQRAAGRARDRGGGLPSGAGRHHGAGRPQPAVAGRRGGRRPGRVGRPGRAGGARPAPHRAA